MSNMGGLRLRLTISIAAILLLVVGASFVVIYRGTGRDLRQQIDHELAGQADALSIGGVPGDPAKPWAVAARARRFLSQQPFGSSRRLLFVKVKGGAVVTNEPELLGVAQGEREGMGVQHREDREARALLGAPRGYSTVRDEDVGEIRLLVRPVRRGGSPLATVGVGEALQPVARAQRGVRRTFLLAGLLALTAALVVGYLVATRISGPLRRMARAATAVDAGDLSHRMDASGPRDEVRVLADAFNHMLERLEDAFARQRTFVADASHELRTPLTVIRGQIDVLAREQHVSQKDVRRTRGIVSTEIARLERLVEDLLLLAQSDEQPVRREPIDVPAFVHELVDGFAATPDRRFEVSHIPQGQLQADPDQLAQVLRNILVNAVKHTSHGGLIRLDMRASEGRVQFAVQDDGPGIPAEQRHLVFDRFHRTDSARGRTTGGTGLGLAIARAIIEAHGGSIRAEQSPPTGARIVFDLPNFQPTKEPAS